MKKRIVSLILAVLVVAGLATAVFATEPAPSTVAISTSDAVCPNDNGAHELQTYPNDKYKKDTDTCTGHIEYYYSCAKCQAKITDRTFFGKATHEAAKRTYPNAKYLISEKTCTSHAVYYMSCATCGGKLADTFEDKNSGYAAHKPAEVVSDAYLESAATCTEPAVYYKSCSVCLAKLETEPTFKSGAALGHDYDIEWTFASDYKTASAVLTCKRDKTHTATITEAPVTSVVTKTATCKDEGEVTYTAKGTADGVQYTGTLKVITPKTNTHNLVKVPYVAPTYKTAGTKEHYKCSVCGALFWDKDGKKPVAKADDVVIPAKKDDYYYGATLYFETNGGSKIDAVTVYTDTTIDLTLAKYTPTRRGYTFAGWYSDKNLRYPISEITLKTGWFLNKYNTYTVYAGWYDGDYDYNCSACAFRDVDVNDWFHDYVRYVVDNGILNGISSRWFEPQQAMTREQLVCAMYRIAGSPSVRYNGVFTDVKSTDSFAKAVEWAANYGIVNGIGNKLFDPYSPVTREQMAAIFYRFAKYVEKYGYTPYRTTGFYWNYSSTLTFKDADKISNYAKDPVAWCVKNGIFYGDNSNRFNPTNSTTRAEGAAILTRFCK